MKKLFISLLLINLLSIYINADQYDEDGTYTVSVTYSKSPTYLIRIPESVDVSSDTSSFYLQIKGDIYAGQSVSAIFQQTANLYDEAGRYFTVTVVQEKSSWSYSELSDTYQPTRVSLAHTSINAGSWQGSLILTISLQGG